MSERPPHVQILLGGLAASNAVLFSNPFEVLKTRLQLQGELVGNQRSEYKGILHGFRRIVLNDGVRGLQQGLGAAMLYQFIMNGTRLGLHGPIKQHLGADPDDSWFFAKSVLAGGTSGILGAFAGSPLKLVTTRLQSRSSAKTAVGSQHNYRGLGDAIRQIVAEDGVLGLYRGVSASMLRVATGSSVQLGTYDQTKKFIKSTTQLEEGLPLHLGASLVSGVAVTLAMNPADVISTRMYNQPGGTATLYSGLWDCVAKTWRAEGVIGFYKGVVAHYIRLGPHTVFTFVLWEQWKLFATRLGY